MKQSLLIALAVLATAPVAKAAQDAVNTDFVQPNSPYKAEGMPDAGTFNPNWRYRRGVPLHQAPTAMFVFPPADYAPPAPQATGYKLVAAPTLPPAPGYGYVRLRRADRN